MIAARLPHLEPGAVNASAVKLGVSGDEVATLSVVDLKVYAAEAFKQGLYEQACTIYSQALAEQPEDSSALCNRSVARLRLGDAQGALRDADAATALLGGCADSPPAAPAALLAKAQHRRAEALLALGRTVEAIRSYRLAAAGPAAAQPALRAALRLAAERLPARWLARYWGGRVEAAQAPNPLSARDGLLLRAVPRAARLDPGDLEAVLCAALEADDELAHELRDQACEAWASGRKPGRSVLALVRSAAYLQNGDAQQATRDARFALAYGPKRPDAPPAARPAPAADTPAKAGGKGGGKGDNPPEEEPELPPLALAGRDSAWPAALRTLSSALEAAADNVPAALAAARAAELLQAARRDPGAAGEALQRLLRRVPEPVADVLRAGGAAGLEAALRAELLAARPEFLRQRPKYYYYYEWMRKRITAQYPELPGPVMDKLLTLEAAELDLILQYPQATQQTVENVLGVYRLEGEAYLETYRVPLLSWEQVKELTGPDTVGLPLGSAGPAPLQLDAGEAAPPPPASRPALGDAGSAAAATLGGEGTGVEAAAEGTAEGAAEGAALETPEELPVADLPPPAVLGGGDVPAEEWEDDAGSDAFSDLYELD